MYFNNQTEFILINNMFDRIRFEPDNNSYIMNKAEVIRFLS